ncbi:nuclear transport factor 2 family protein [Paenibacillus piscarius]|uniref:nuclear transport factor 2 family protein n=1 Tax=Paenibacillus piscarius TaxID=1089681 RepID=UPI001EE94681|nr:nuclear transport factor 2 family protein [Paenibacillus piscarius]
MVSQEEQDIIETYIRAYNSFDIQGMVDLMHQDVIFRNISDGVITTETSGIPAFRALAEQSSTMFSSRRQIITGYSAAPDSNVAVTIDYEGILAVDLPGGLAAGDTLQLKGTSTFSIKDGLISLIEDYS